MSSKLSKGDIVEFHGSIGVVVYAAHNDYAGVRWIVADPYSTVQIKFAHNDSDCVFGVRDTKWKLGELVKIAHAD